MTEFSRTQYNFNNRIILNDVTTDTTKYIITGVPAASDTVVLNTEDEKPEQAGIIDYGSKLGRGVFVFPATLFATTTAKMNELIQDLKEALNPDLLEADPTYGDGTKYYGYHPLEWTEDVGATSRAFRVFAKPKEIPQVATDSLSGNIRRTTLEFKVADPRKYLQTQSTLSGAGTAANAGTYTTPVVITVTASGATSTSLTITNSTTGESIYVTTALSNGQVLVIDTGSHSVKLDGTETRSMLSGTSTWWLLNPGNNTLAISNSTNASVSFAWYSAWPL